MELTSENNLQLSQNLDLIEETKDIAALQIEKYHKMAQYFHGTKVWPRKFQEGDWVLKRVVGNQKKFKPNWEGHFEITKALGLRS